MHKRNNMPKSTGQHQLVFLELFQTWQSFTFCSVDVLFYRECKFNFEMRKNAASLLLGDFESFGTFFDRNVTAVMFMQTGVVGHVSEHKKAFFGDIPVFTVFKELVVSEISSLC